MGKPKKSKQSPEDKVRAVAPELVDAAESMSVPELKVEIAKRAMFLSESKEAEKEDSDLGQAKESLKLLQQPYRDDQKGALAVIGWLSKLVEARGADGGEMAKTVSTATMKVSVGGQQVSSLTLTTESAKMLKAAAQKLRDHAAESGDD